MKKIKYIKMRWYIIAISCLVLFGIGLYMFLSNNNNPTNLSAKTDNINNVSFSDKSNKKIYGEITTERSWVYDPTDPENLLKNGSVAVKVKVLSVDDAKFLSTDTDKEITSPATPYTVEILNVYNNKNADKKVIKELQKKNSQLKVYVSGGLVSMKEASEFYDNDVVKKLDFGDIKEEEQKDYYISYTSDCYYEMTPGQEYLVVLAPPTKKGEYFTACQGYGIFKATDNSISGFNAKSALPDYKNVITGNSLKID